jgi:hypothetical protein
VISFWIPAGNSAVAAYRAGRGRSIAHRLAPRDYEDLGPRVHVTTGPQVLAALDQLSEAQRHAVAWLWDEHARLAPSATRWNDPRVALTRFALLRRLAADGLNGFGVYGCGEIDAIRRFPVFVRGRHDHSGPRSRLLHTRGDVSKAIAALRVRGRRKDDLMIVEFADTTDADGWFRKYAAFRAGDRIIACHAFVAREWCVKSEQKQLDEAWIHEDRAFVRDNPHAAWLRRVFTAAGIDYGRADYGVVSGVPQLWEINLNPTIGRRPGQSKPVTLAPELQLLREETRETFHAQLRDALVAIDNDDDGDVELAMPAELSRRLQSDAARRQRARRARSWAHAVYKSPILGFPFRKALTLMPRR